MDHFTSDQLDRMRAMYDTYRTEEDQVGSQDTAAQVPAIVQVPAVVQVPTVVQAPLAQAPVVQVPAVVQAPVVQVLVVQNLVVQVPQSSVIDRPTCRRLQKGRYCRRSVQCCSRTCSSNRCQ
jgi:hypothetical protein